MYNGLITTKYDEEAVFGWYYGANVTMSCDIGQP